MAVKGNVLLCVTGSVAGVKASALTSSLVEMGYDVRVACTPHSRRFVNTQELEKLAGRVYEDEDEWRDWRKVGDDVMHIELRRWADVLLVAPLSANTLGKVANGLCDNLVTCVIRAWPVEDPQAPFIVAPAMNTFMWKHPLTRRHVDILVKDLNAKVVQPVEKTLACGDVGMGAMASVVDITMAVADVFT